MSHGGMKGASEQFLRQPVIVTSAGYNPPLSHSEIRGIMRLRWSTRAIAELMSTHERSQQHSEALWKGLGEWKFSRIPEGR
jgi:hypothetical protein